MDGDIICDFESMSEMEERIQWLTKTEPTTIRGAREVLNVVLKILAYHEVYPDRDVYSEAPILAILRKVRDAPDFVDGDIPVGSRSRSRGLPRGSPQERPASAGRFAWAAALT